MPKANQQPVCVDVRQPRGAGPIYWPWLIARRAAARRFVDLGQEGGKPLCDLVDPA